MSSNYCKRHPRSIKPCEICKEEMQQKTLSAKIKCLEHYGSSCACCGETEIKFLCLDHVDGGGNDHRKELFGTKNAGGYRMDIWIIKNNFPDGFRFLCFNCNCARHYFDRCPHE